MDEELKKCKFSARIPYKSGPKWDWYDGYGGDDELRRTIIAQLDGKKPKDRERVPLYYYGKKDGTLYWNGDLKKYVYETKDYVAILYKNGKTGKIFWKHGDPWAKRRN